jgi:cysteine desulfurase
MKPRVYLDYAATTPMLPEVRQAMGDISEKAFGNPSSTHAEGRMARTVIEEARRTVAQHLGASLGEIFFTSCGTETNNMILRSCVRDLGVDTIITSPVEHPCVLNTCAYLHRHYGTRIVFVPVRRTGQVDMDALRETLSSLESGRGLVSLMHVNNEIGSVHDLMAIGALCREHGAYFHSDTVQSIGFHRFDLPTLPIDFIAGSAHKFYGPKGIGFVYIRSGLHIQPLLYGGSQERNMRAGTENLPGIHGLARALQEADATLALRMEQLNRLHQHMRDMLLEIVPGVTFNEAEVGHQSTKILSANFPAGPRTEMLLLHLDIEGISASGGSACSSGAEAPSHVLEHVAPDETGKTIRFSFAPCTTLDDLNYVGYVLKKLFVA